MGVRQRVKYVYYTFMVSVVARIVFEPTVGGEFVQPAIMAGQESRRLGASASSAGYYEVVTTNYGWNTPQSASFSRRILGGELFNATLAHPRYNASAWADLEVNPDPERRIIAFMDVETCIESNYPVYGAADWKVNVEPGHPELTKSIVRIVPESCQYIKKAANSPALKANPDSRLVVLDCSGVEKVRIRHACSHDPEIFKNDQVIVVAYMSVEKSGLRPFFDVGVVPPAIKPIDLTIAEREAIQSCEKRKYLFSFQGRRGFGREKLSKFSNETDMYIRLYDERDSYKKDIRKDGFGDSSGGKVDDSNNYKGVMKDSVFAGSPRGDLLFSYRFSEILSAGAIPVVYADGWLPPFNEHVVDWSKCAVFIPESHYDKTGEILRAIPEETRCEMQKCVVDVWDRFAVDRVGWVRAFVAVAQSTSAFGIDPVGSET